jgi:hypothetical protein
MTKKRRAPIKFTAAGKMTLTAVSLIGFIGGWNVIARLENQPAQAAPANPVPAPIITPTPAGVTAWPTISPLPAVPPIPTLALSSSDAARAPEVNVGQVLELAPVDLAPLPTLAPLPDLPQAPPPPPPVVLPAGNWNQSGSS